MVDQVFKQEQTLNNSWDLFGECTIKKVNVSKEKIEIILENNDKNETFFSIVVPSKDNEHEREFFLLSCKNCIYNAIEANEDESIQNVLRELVLLLKDNIKIHCFYECEYQEDVLILKSLKKYKTQEIKEEAMSIEKSVITSISIKTNELTQGEFLRMLKIIKHKTTSQIAICLNLNDSCIYHYESDKRKIPKKYLKKLAEFFDIDEMLFQNEKISFELCQL